LPENKQLLKDKLGFTGYKIGEFNPRMTRVPPPLIGCAFMG